jgi:hypothetical protein
LKCLVVSKFCRRAFINIFEDGGTIQDGGFFTFYFQKFVKNLKDFNLKDIYKKWYQVKNKGGKN